MTSDNVNLIRHECINCHILFWISGQHDNTLNSTKESFCCPNGHKQSYTGKSDKDKLREKEVELEKYKGFLENSDKESNKYYNKSLELEKELKALKKPKEKPKDEKDKKTKKDTKKEKDKKKK